jgi:hypothetical protein
MDSFESFRREADLARAYIQITSEMGPCPALLAFVNYDKNLKDVVGLEKFDSLSTEAQHEILLSTLDPDRLDQMALENLSDKLKKLSNHLLLFGAGGILGAAVTKGKTRHVLAGVGAVLGFTGIIVEKISNHLDKDLVTPFSNFIKYKELFSEAFNADKFFLRSMPKSFSKAEWSKFNTDVLHDHTSSYSKITIKLHDKLKSIKDEKIHISKSGWTIENLKAAAKWIETARKERDALEFDFYTQVIKIENWVENHDEYSGHNTTDDEDIILGCINSTVDYVNYRNLTEFSDTIIYKSDKILYEASKFFEKKK